MTKTTIKIEAISIEAEGADVGEAFKVLANLFAPEVRDDQAKSPWRLYYCDQESGRDHLSQEGSEQQMKQALQSAADRGEDAWLIDPSGGKHLPTDLN